MIESGTQLCPSSNLGQPFQPQNPVAVGQSGIKLLDPNPNRKEFSIQNTGTTILAIKLGSIPNYNSGDFHYLLNPGQATRDGFGGTFIDGIWQGSVWIVSNQVAGECVIVEKI